MIKLTINDQTVEVEQGSTVLQAAKKLGIKVPTLCDHPQLHPYGACRLCLVEVEGARTLMPSCTLAATENMVVHTNTKRVAEARKFVLSMLFSERNHFCMYCQATDGDCELQNAAYDEDMNHWPITPAYLPFAVDASHPDFILDNNRCILCRRCVRACGELVGNFTLGFEERGSASFLVADDGLPLGESSCISCGNCVQICPTGALIDRRSMYQGRLTDLEHKPSVCMECSLGCERDVLVRDSRLVRLDGNVDGDFNAGLLCEKGRYTPLNAKGKRIQKPMLRKDGSLQEVSFEEALKVLSEQFKKAASVSASISARQSLENLAAFKSVMKAAGAEKVHVLNDDPTAWQAVSYAKDNGAFEASLESLKEFDLAIVLGADLLNDHEVAGFMVKRQLASGSALVNASKEANDLGIYADQKMELFGAEPSVALELCKDLKQASNAAKWAEKCNATEADFEALSALFNGSGKKLVIVGKQFAQAEQFASCVALAQQIDAKFIALKGAVNTYAAAQMEYASSCECTKADLVYMALGDEKPCCASDQCLSNASFKVLQAAYDNELSSQVDLVLPATIWAEEEGHFMAGDGRVRMAQKAIEPEASVLSTAAVMQALAEKLGLEYSADWQSQCKYAALEIAA
jgi:formate dehydrogenase major subunit